MATGSATSATVANLLVRRGRDEDLAAHRRALHPGGDIDRAAHHGVLGPLLGADIADHRLAGIDADAHLEAGQATGGMLAVDVGHRGLHGQGAGGGALRVVGMRERRPEDREDGVADELVDRAAVLDHHVGHAGEVLVQHVHDVRGVALLGKARIAPEVGHEHGHHALLAAEAQAVGRLEQLAGDLGRHVAPERRADEVALAEAVEHLVEGAREPAQLVRRANGQRLRQVAARHARHPRGQGADRPCQAPGEEQAQDQRADRPDRRGVHERGPELMEPVEVDLDRVVDLDDGGHATRPDPGSARRR